MSNKRHKSEESKYESGNTKNVASTKPGFVGSELFGAGSRGPRPARETSEVWRGFWGETPKAHEREKPKASGRTWTDPVV